jgi:hypothetical protein
VSLFDITQADRGAWQRRAAAALTAIPDRYRDLPVITWTVGPAGAVLNGHVNVLTAAVEDRQALDARQALTPTELSQTTCSDGTDYPRAVADRGRARLALIGTVFDHGESEG